MQVKAPEVAQSLWQWVLARAKCITFFAPCVPVFVMDEHRTLPRTRSVSNHGQRLSSDDLMFNSRLSVVLQDQEQ